jgi:hypothetical protein
LFYRRSALSLTSVKQQATLRLVKIRSFAHKGLKRLYEEDDAKGVGFATAGKLRKMLLFLDEMKIPRSCVPFQPGRRMR